MAVTLDVQALGVGLRITTHPTHSTGALVEPELGILTLLLAVATEHVERRAPDAPDDVHDEAAIRLCGWLYDSPPAERRTVQSAYLHSGAAGLLAPWVERRGG